MKKRFHRILAAIAIAGAVLVAGMASANFNVTPIRLELTPSGAGSQAVLRVQNRKQQPLAIETFAVSRDVGEDGQEVRTPSDDDFVLFPPQAYIQPGETQAFTVRYAGDPALAVSRYYGVGLREVPAETPSDDEEGANVNISFTYVIATVVSPDGAAPDVRVESIAPAGDEGMAVTISNSGNKHAVLSRSSWTLSGDSGETELAEATDFAFLGFPLLEPGTTRTFTLPAEAYEEVGAPNKIDITLY